MKKGIVAVLIILALVIIVSPGIVGRMAEKGVDENLSWAATESGELVVSSENFERGWFSSEGQHRIELRDGTLKSVLGPMGGTGGDSHAPVLVIDTHLDHGLIPVSSMSREKGSLAPGLGSAVSTLSLELGDGETMELPGTIYSKVSLGGSVRSNFVLEAGSREEGATSASWEPADIDITTDPSSGDVSFAGNIGKLSFTDGSDGLALGSLTFEGSQTQTKYGFPTGDMKLELDSVSFSSNGVESGGIKHVSVDGETSLDGDKVSGRTYMEMESLPIPMVGEFSVVADISVAGADADAIGSLQKTLDAQDPAATQDPAQIFSVVEDDLKRLLASGLELRFDRFDVTLPMGTVMTKLDFKVAEEDADTFDWTSLLLGTEAMADITVPEALVDMAMQMNPQAGAVVGMGFLQKEGDVYKMAAEYKKGLLTINGAPMPIPLGAMR